MDGSECSASAPSRAKASSGDLILLEARTYAHAPIPARSDAQLAPHGGGASSHVASVPPLKLGVVQARLSPSASPRASPRQHLTPRNGPRGCMLGPRYDVLGGLLGEATAKMASRSDGHRAPRRSEPGFASSGSSHGGSSPTQPAWRARSPAERRLSTELHPNVMRSLRHRDEHGANGRRRSAPEITQNEAAGVV
jgi:hypothetical protein